MNKAILWDLDGTLLYTLQDLTNATNATLRAFGLPDEAWRKSAPSSATAPSSKCAELLEANRKIFQK